MTNDNPQTPPPLPPTPVLSYEVAGPRNWSLPARLLCGLAMVNGLVSAGYIGAGHLPTANTGPHEWTDLPVICAGVVGFVFGALGLFRIPGSRMGIMISAGCLMLCNWGGQWVNLKLYGPADNSMIATAIVGVIDNASVPVFLVLCLMREPIKGYFSAR